jgi:hypothetical protein
VQARVDLPVQARVVGEPDPRDQARVQRRSEGPDERGMARTCTRWRSSQAGGRSPRRGTTPPAPGTTRKTAPRAHAGSEVAEVRGWERAARLGFAWPFLENLAEETPYPLVVGFAIWGEHAVQSLVNESLESGYHADQENDTEDVPPPPEIVQSLWMNVATMSPTMAASPAVNTPSKIKKTWYLPERHTIVSLPPVGPFPGRRRSPVLPSRLRRSVRLRPHRSAGSAARRARVLPIDPAWLFA